MNTRQTVVGIFATRDQADRAVEALVNDSYDRSTIDVSADGSVLDEDYHKEKTGGFFENLFGDNDDHRNNHLETARRGTVVTVHTDQMTKAQHVARVLNKYGALNADECAAKLKTQATAKLTDVDTRKPLADGTFEVVEESMSVGKTQAETGSVHVYSRIIEKPVEETVRLREEHVVVNRERVDRPATDADFANRDREITLKETEERAVVDKQARVVEEVHVGKEATEHTETIKDTVRRKDVEVERTGATTASNTDRDLNKNI